MASARRSVAPYFFAVLVAFGLVTLAQNRLFHSTTTSSYETDGGMAHVLESFTDHHPAVRQDDTTSSKIVEYNIPQHTKMNASLSRKSAVAGLSCAAHGGPPDEVSQEMVYWRDIPDDSHHMSPLHRNRHPEKEQKQQPEKQSFAEYLTFEPDRGTEARTSGCCVCPF